MAVKIRLARRGRKKLAMFDIVVSDARSPRDGRFIEKIGTYNPNTNPASIALDTERALHWTLVGAQPTDTARAILSYKGVLMKKHLQVGVNKGAITQEVADQRYAQWEASKAGAIDNKKDSLANKKSEEMKNRLEAERLVREARAKAIAEREAAKNVTEAPAEEGSTAEAAEESAEAAAE